MSVKYVRRPLLVARSVNSYSVVNTYSNLTVKTLQQGHYFSVFIVDFDLGFYTLGNLAYTEFTCSKSTMDKPEQCVKSVQS